MYLGYSTGSVAKGDFKQAIRLLNGFSLEAIELSTLREFELEPFISEMDDIDVSQYKYVSFHAPSKLRDMKQEDLIQLLSTVVRKQWPIIVHPDIITDYSPWKELGRQVCIENMDKRKPIGRTVEDLQQIFDELPEARFCLDVAHARQVDPTMAQCYKMIQKFSDRLIQIHLSDVTTESKHVPLNLLAIEAYQDVFGYFKISVPVIIESPIFPGIHQHELIAKEIQAARELFAPDRVYA